MVKPWSPLFALTVVMVLLLLNVKLIDGFAGSCTSLFPQYFTSAIFDGASHEAVMVSFKSVSGAPLNFSSTRINLNYKDIYFS